MKKLLGILVLGLLWCNVALANAQSSFNVYWKNFYSGYDSCIESYKPSIMAGNYIGLADTMTCTYNKDHRHIKKLISDLISQGYLSDFSKAERLNDISFERYTDLFQEAKSSAKNFILEIPGSSQRFRTKVKEIISESKINMRNVIEEIELAKGERTEPTKTAPETDNNKIVAASSGTGFFVSSSGQLITNNHVIDGCNSVKLNYAGSEYKANTIASDKTNDLALLKTNINPKSIFSISGEDAALLEEVFVAGFPLGKKVSAAIKVTSGRVSALAGINDNYSNFQIDAALNHGNSGGPIVNKKGNVVGVAVATIDKSVAESFNFGIKSSVVKSFTKSNNVNLSSPNRRQMDMKDLGSLVTDATVMLECWMSIAKIKKIIAAGDSRKAFYSKYK